MNSFTGLEKARIRLREKREAGVTARLSPTDKAQLKPNSLRLAVTAKCVECMGGASVPNFRKDIRECTSPTCPLYAVRPYQRKEEDEHNAEEPTGELSQEK